MWRDEEGGAFELGTDGPKVILVGVDDSVTSLRAAAYAAGLARGREPAWSSSTSSSCRPCTARPRPFSGAGPACWDLCWYLALNRARLPEHKEAVTSRFRASLEDHGIGAGSWWHEQLDLCMIGVMATFGWEKALGDGGELSWWEATAVGVDRRPGRLMPMAPRV